MEHPLNLTSFLPAGIQHHYLHVIMLCVAVCIIFLLGLYVRTLRSEIPSKSQNFFEVLVGGISNLAVDVMGKEGKPYLPIVFGIGLYVAVSNLMGLIPGLIPPTSNMNTTAAPAIFVFFLYNFIGIKKHGASYIKHFLGPLPALAPFMLIIEIISHLARPLSLTMRLFGNIIYACAIFITSANVLLNDIHKCVAGICVYDADYGVYCRSFRRSPLI